MEKKIEKVAVIGAGIMGAGLAAHLSNVGFEPILLDIVPPGGPDEQDKKKGLTEKSPDFRNKLAKFGRDMSVFSKPASYYLPENANLITAGNLEDNLEDLKDVDWVLEAIIERLDIKQALYTKLEAILKPGAIITSNTSGISAASLCEGRTKAFRENFAITHFFNPPRYMKLLEIVPGPDTRQEVIDTMVEINEKELGKGIVYGKDTPCFVANRIGIYRMYEILKVTRDLGITLEAADKLTGSIIGGAKSATFRTADLVGLDTLFHVGDYIYEAATNDEKREHFKTPDFIKEMLEKNMLGEKTKQGFYKKGRNEKGKKQILSLDFKTMEYVPQEKVNIPSLEAAKKAPSLEEKLKTLFYADDVGGQFSFRTFSGAAIYAANRVPEIADDIVNIDNGSKYGFGLKMGPFESWDAIGVPKSVAKMKEAGFEIPAWVEEMLKSGKESFYKKENGVLHFYDVASKDYKKVPIDPGVILLPSLKDQKKSVAENKGASLVDIGDGVACLEFHTKMNALGEDIVTMMIETKDIVSKNFDGLVIANHGSNFSAGANLPLVLATAQEKKWDDLHLMVKTLQDTLMGLKYLDKPVVAAPAGMALGGGCEICMHADKVRFAAESYVGLVEVGVGLLPAGGGTKEMILRNTEHLFEVPKGGLHQSQIDLAPFLSRAFETIAMAKVATSGPEAVKLGLFRSTDKMTVNRDYLINDAKKTILAMNMEGYKPQKPKQNIRVAGEKALATFNLALWSMHKSGFVLDHDLVVSAKIAHVICGGEVFENTKVSEQYLLDLEREAFVSLCGEPKTQDRIKFMLEKGKPLRN